MKVATLLAQYLYTSKKLDLTGIGSFTLDPSVVTDPDQKQGKQLQLDGVSFTENPAVKEDDELVSFISVHTGKMKALAAADLDSYLALARQFLNIGKPFQIEGVGTLVKTKTHLEFTPGAMVAEKMKDNAPIKDPGNAASEESFTGFEDVYNNSSASSRNKKRRMLLGSLTIAGLLLAIAGGFYIARNMNKDNAAAVNTTDESTTVISKPEGDTLPRKDTPTTTTHTAAAATIPAGSFKIVIEEAGKTRALKRFSQLKNAGHAVQLETADSVNFKLFYVMNISPADTSRVVDSFSRNYPAVNKKRAYVENR